GRGGSRLERELGERRPAIRGPSFFFQAEDGIRDSSVTGVQTCALPIYDIVAAAATMSFLDAIAADPDRWLQSRAEVPTDFGMVRSEERRVGKEGMVGGAAKPLNQNEKKSACATENTGKNGDE